MSNILIRGGTIVDGTGAPAYKSDVRVKNGLIGDLARQATILRRDCIGVGQHQRAAPV